MRYPRNDLTNSKFGRLLVLRWAGPNQRNQSLYDCQCDCGSLLTVVGSQLSRGHTSSCGCLQRERASIGAKEAQTTHGHTNKEDKEILTNGTRTYQSWMSMKARCLNPAKRGFKYWGGRGITVCQRWLDSFENFLADMGTRPAGTTLDRFPDKNGNYEPGNCRWANWIEQANNRRERSV